jgi:hypothetical protein
MNNVPGVLSQSFSLPDLFNSAAGGGHHVITNRHQLSDYKLMGLDPLVHRVITPSTASFYLAAQASQYPTAWLDLDGNERASVQLRNSDLNKIHILLLQLAKPDLPPNIRDAAGICLRDTIDRRRLRWTRTAAELEQEMRALDNAISERQKIVDQQPKRWTPEQRDEGADKAARRLADELQAWEREHAEYTAYISHLRALLNLHPEPRRAFKGKISDFVPELSLGDSNTVADLAHYVVGPAPGGLVVDSSGRLDEARSFVYVNYFSLLAQQRVRNNPQSAISSDPIDFIAMRVPARTDSEQSYWLYGEDDHELIIHTNSAGEIRLEPVMGNPAEPRALASVAWRAGLPLHLFEDPELQLPPGSDRAAWLSGWHTEREWLNAIHMCQYSNGVIGTIEELSPVAGNVPGRPGMDPILLRFERRRRELVQPDLEVFAADHWNFNVRNPNPGGNHGAFFRISTHSVWMMAAPDVPIGIIKEPYDSLNFASTLMAFMGRTPPMPDRVVNLADFSPVHPASAAVKFRPAKRFEFDIRMFR